jgi:hypothetical protein
MDVHVIVVFIHVLAVALTFTMVGVEAVALPRFRRATTRSEATGWAHIIESVGKTHGILAVVLLASGLFLMLKYWHHQPWIDMGILGLVTLAGLGGGVTGRAMGGVEKALASGSGNDIPAAVRAVQTGALLVRSMRVRISIGITMVAIMVLKPGYAGCITIVVAVIGVGWLVGMRADKAEAAGKPRDQAAA